MTFQKMCQLQCMINVSKHLHVNTLIYGINKAKISNPPLCLHHEKVFMA